MTGRNFFEENREKYKSQNGDREEYNMCHDCNYLLGFFE